MDFKGNIMEINFGSPQLANTLFFGFYQDMKQIKLT